MADVLLASLASASSLVASTSSWLEAHGATGPLDAQRSCRDEPMTIQCLPALPLIAERAVERGAREPTAHALAAVYASEMHKFGLWIVQQYADFLEEIASLHEYCGHYDPVESCSPHFLCPLSSRTRSTYLDRYSQQAARLADVALECLRPKPTASPVNISHTLIDCNPILEFAFAQCPKPTTHEKAILATITGRTLKQISIWFQNRRARTKRSAFQKRTAVQSIEDLEELLRDQWRGCLVTQRAAPGESSGNESHDSGYYSDSDPNIDKLTILFAALTLADGGEAAIQSNPPASRMTHGRSISTSPEAGPVRRAALHKPKKKTRGGPQGDVQARPSSCPEARPRRRVSSVATGNRTQHRLPGQAIPEPPAPSLDVPSSATSYLDSSPASASSGNKASRARKMAPLPVRRPIRQTVSSPCPESLSSPSSSAAASRVPSLSSQSSVSSVSSDTDAAQQEDVRSNQLYYKDARTGHYIPIAGPNVHVILPGSTEDRAAHEVADHPCHAVLLGSAEQAQVAPDDNPRAFSSNILQRHSASHFAPAEVAPFIDASCAVPDPPCSRDGNVLDGTPAPAPLDPVHAFAGCELKDTWVNPAPLDVVTYAYDSSWTTTPSSVNSWAHLLGVDL